LIGAPCGTSVLERLLHVWFSRNCKTVIKRKTKENLLFLFFLATRIIQNKKQIAELKS
jgi:hypothetical protein